MDGHLSIGGNTPITRIGASQDGAILSLGANGPRSLAQYFGPAGEGHTLTLHVQTIHGKITFSVADSIISIGDKHVDFNVPMSGRKLLADISSGDRFILAMSKPISDVSGLEGWLKKQDAQACVAFASRMALRIIPLLHSKYFGDRDTGPILASIYAIAAAWTVGTWPKFIDQIGHSDILALYPTIHEIVVAVPGVDSLALIETHEFDPQDDTIHLVAMDLAGSVETCLQEYDDQSVLDAWDAFRTDMQFLSNVGADAEFGHLASLSQTPLWPKGIPKTVARHWTTMKTFLLSKNEDWQVWIEWYEDRLWGRPAHADFEAKRLLTVEEAVRHPSDADTRIDPSRINSNIKTLIDNHLAECFPLRQILVLNTESGQIELASVRISDEPLYERICIQIEDSLEPFSSLQYSNIYSEILSPVRLLSFALEKRRHIPMIVHRRVAQVLREIDRLILNDDALSDFNVRTLREDLNYAVTAIPESVPAVAEEVAKRSRARMNELAESDRQEIRQAAELLAERSDESLAELVTEGVDALQGRGEDLDIVANEGVRIYTLGWMLFRLPDLRSILDRLTASADIVSKLNNAMNAAENIKGVLLRLFAGSGSGG